MTATAEWKQKLSDSARVCRTDRKEIVEQFSQSSRKMTKQLKRLGLDGNYQAKNDADKKLRDLYYSRWIAAVYPIVDMSFTAEKLNLLVRRTEAGAEIIGVKDREPNEPTERVAAISKYAIQRERGRSSLFAALPDPPCNLGTCSFPQFQLNRERYRSFVGNVRCNRPEGYPTCLRQRLRDVVALALEAHAAGIRAGVSVGQAEFSRAILWAPRIEDMYIHEEIPVRDDPAILVMSGERAHLIGFWDSPNENPIEGVLREFSEGSFENVLAPETK